MDRRADSDYRTFRPVVCEMIEARFCISSDPNGWPQGRRDTEKSADAGWRMAPWQGRGELLQPLPGCVSLFLFYPGVRFAHPRLISLRPVGAGNDTVSGKNRT